MKIEIKVPSPGESISEVEVANWFFASGDFVEKDQEIGEIESEKATLPLIADESGQLEILKEVGETVPVGMVVCTIDTSVESTVNSQQSTDDSPQTDDKKQPATSSSNEASAKLDNQQQATSSSNEASAKLGNQQPSSVKSTPLAKKIMEENNLNVEDIIKGLKKLSSKEVKAVMSGLTEKDSFSQAVTTEISREESRTELSNLRKKLSQRLVAVKNETAMLTTFNEADMTKIMELRKKYQVKFVEKHGVKLGFMSFFTKAASEALKLFPNVNSRIEKDDIVTPSYYDIGIAVQTDKGLTVPVLRNTEVMGLAEIENKIIELANKARKNRLSIEEMSGGSFTITNGGIFGSMLSTPILNPPQSAILGMHNILERPVAIDGQVVIRPMMYLALSYDHRIVDGRDSVGFLKQIKEFIENPEAMLYGGKNLDSMLLEL